MNTVVPDLGFKVGSGRMSLNVVGVTFSVMLCTGVVAVLHASVHLLFLLLI